MRFQKGYDERRIKTQFKNGYDPRRGNPFTDRNGSKYIINTGRTRFKKGQSLQKGKYRLSTILNLWFSPRKLKRKFTPKIKIPFKKVCIKCNKIFYTLRNNQKYCINPCRYTFEKGHIQPKEWIDKQRIKISGDKCWLWKGGISKEPYGIEFSNLLRERIRRRDKFTCQECGFIQNQLGYKLIVHHIDFNKKNNHPSNLISLCRSCHAQTNYNRNDWIEYFQNKVNGIG